MNFWNKIKKFKFFLGIIDYTLCVGVGFGEPGNSEGTVGFTIGPFFLTLDRNGDIWWMSPTFNGRLTPPWLSKFAFEYTYPKQIEDGIPDTIPSSRLSNNSPIANQDYIDEAFIGVTNSKFDKTIN